MGLYDDLLEEQPKVAPQQNVKNNTKNSGLYDDLLVDETPQAQPTFAENHPFVASLPEAGKQLGIRTVKSFPEFAKGTNDLLALLGDKTHLQGLSDSGRSNADFWQTQSDKIQIDPKYQGVKGLSSKKTFIPTVLGSVGDQATNLLMAGGGGGAGAKAAATMGLKGAAKAGLITAGTSIPNLAQEGQYLDKIQAFQELNGRMPTIEELKQIQNVALGEKAINTALETVSDRLLFGKLFPEGAVTKGVKGILKNAGQQAITEAATEGMQEGVSIGAENLLGINQGNNLERLADSMAIGGITGGVMGGVTSAAARPIDTQFTENAVNPVEVLQNVSAKIVDGGKVLYDSAADKLSNAANTINNAASAVGEMVNTPDTFDTLKDLSRSGTFSNSNKIAELAPKTVAKQNVQNIINNSSDTSVQNTNVPNMLDNSNLYNVEENGEKSIVNEQEVQNIANEVEQTAPSENTSAVAEKPKSTIKKAKKDKARTEAIKRIKKIAPKTAEKMQQTDHIEQPLDMGNSDVQNKENHIDQAGDMVQSDEKTQSKEDEIEKIAKEYSEMLGQDEVREFHKDFAEALVNKNAGKIKVLVAQSRGYNEKSKKMFTKYTGIKLPTTIKGKIETIDKWAKGEIVKEEPKTFNNTNKTITFKDKDLKTQSGQQAIMASDKYITNGHIAFVKDYFNFGNNQSDFKHIDTSKKEYIFNREFNSQLDKYLNNQNITEKLEKPMLTKNRGDSYVLFKNGGKYVAFDKKYFDMIKDFDIYMGKNSNRSQAIIKNKAGESIGILMPVLLKDLNTALTISKPLKHKKNEAIYSSSKISNESEVDNGRSIEKTNGIRSTVSEKEETTSTDTEKLSQEQSSNERSSDEVGRGNDVSNDGQRGISQKDKEIIEKEYKNQHELNKAIEDYINNGEYKKYAGSVRMPQAIKDWLKKYAGAGGLEKQGAEGKGLLSEYYTPQNVVNKMWDLTKQYVNTNGAKVLEPSVGIGRFIENAPENTSFDAIEMNPVSAKITKILYPDTNVTTGEFQEKFIDKTNNKPVKLVNPEYDIVIGNPPYGQYAGRYKGMGEGKKYSRLEAYFINRGLDSLKENGIMTFIIPSSFLDGAITPAKQEIGSKCELLDAYRLPENTFGTTSIGTDIIVLRKTNLKSNDKNLSLGKWFNEHPEKVLGTIEERKNRFGKMENYVKGDKEAVNNIDTTKTDIKETVVKDTKVPHKNSAAKKSDHIANVSKKVKKPAATVKGKVEYTEYQHENVANDREMELWEHTTVDGSLKGNYKAGKDINQYKGKLYNDFNYLQGNIYEKLDELENENMSEEQRETQKKKLLSVLPKEKAVEEISFNPTSDFIREHSLLKNSSDSFMFQKLNEKTDRINNIMDESKEYIDTSELNTAEEKINMISNPEKKMKMFIQVEKQKLNAKVKDLEGRLETSRTYLNNLKSDERMLKNSQERYSDTEKALKNINPETDKWNYEYTERRLKEYKKDISTYSLSLKKIKEKIARLELDFEGKDSEEAINSEIEKVNKDIKEVEEYGKKKLVEFTEEYEKERLNSKTIDDLIKDFEKDTIDLYGDSKSEDSKPLVGEPQKRYEKTREAVYSVPVINLETKSQKQRKSKTKERIEKAKQIVDARKYNKILKDGIHKWKGEIGIRRYEVDRTLNNFINITRQISKELKVNDKNLREIMPFLRERTELPEKLNRPELVKVWEKVHNTTGMAERLTRLADTLSNKTEKFWNEYKSIQANGEYTGDENGVENYINHEWDLEDKQTKNLLTNYFSTSSKHGKQRTIKTYYDGINGVKLENGEIKQFKPKTLDYAELVKMQTDNLIKATCDKALADSVKSFKTSEGANLILPASQAPSSWVEINHSALNKTVARPVKTSFGEKVAPDLQNMLAKMGVAIGNRLPSRKGNGQPNSLGRFVKNEPPEIRLQRWFSNKTLAHEVGHALDNALKLKENGFVNRHKQELMDLNRERIEAFSKQGDKHYAEKDSELIAELFGVMFNDLDTAYQIAPTATNEVIEKMTKNNMENLLPANFDWAEAKHVMEEKVVEFFKVPVRVHPDIAATLKTVFEPKKEYLDILGFKPGKVLDEQTAIMKMLEFSVSGFHNVALTESYLGNVGFKGLKETFNLKNVWNALKNNEYDVYKKDKIASQAIQDGLQIGTPLDIDRGTVETIVNNVGNWAEKNIPYLGKSFSMITKTAEKGIEVNNKILWDVIHNNYKLTTYELLVNQEAEKGAMTDAKRKEIAQWVNDSFGGLAMENLGITPSAKKMMSRWLMSPDWLIATTRQFMGIFSTETGHKKLNKLANSSEFWQKAKEVSQVLGIHSLTDDVTASGVRGRIARKFWIRSAIISALYMNILNAIFRMKDKDDYPELYPEKLTPKDYSMLGNSTGAKLYVFIGRNKDGTERYLRLGKQFREVPEMVADPIKHFGAKLAPVWQSGATVFTGRNIGGFEDKEMADAKGWKRIGLGAKNLGSRYVPLSIQNAYNKEVKGIGSDFTPFDLIGNTSKGMSKYKAKEQFMEAYKKGNKQSNIEAIEKSMRRNSFSEKDIKSIKQSTMTSYTKPFKDGYKEALANGDMKKIEKISNEMTKKNISPTEQRKVYMKALKDFYKEKGI